MSGPLWERVVLSMSAPLWERTLDVRPPVGASCTLDVQPPVRASCTRDVPLLSPHRNNNLTPLINRPDFKRISITHHTVTQSCEQKNSRYDSEQW